MVHGRIVRPPRYDATLTGFDDVAVRALPGVLAVVRDGNFLGVLAEREEQAVKARAALLASARWSGGRTLPDPDSVHARLQALPNSERVLSEKSAPLPDGARRVEATYRKPYISHGSIGPSCALAEFRDGRLTVWTHSQGVFPLRGQIARALKLPPESVRCVHAQGSGCYGHNGADDVALDAALLARALPGRPVRLQWMRDDEFAWEPYGAAMTIQASGAVSGGRVVDWNYEVWSNTHSTRPTSTTALDLLAAWSLAEPLAPAPPTGGGDRNSIPLYDFPRQRVVSRLIPEMPLRVSALRTLGAYANVLALESFMDELAFAANVGPLAFRLAHLSDPRGRAVLESVARRAGWKDGDKGDGRRGRGIAFAKYKNDACYVAVVAEVEVDRRTGTVRVPHVYAAADAGLIINPDGLRNQIEGGIIQSTSWTLKEAVRFDREGIRSRDWSSYPILTMTEVPKVDIELISRPEEKALGSGEASVGPAAAAIANAFAHATGRRIREVPLTPARVRAALA
jgi:CO/xanthine dehydrogenase Mo-binding subunit